MTDDTVSSKIDLPVNMIITCFNNSLVSRPEKFKTSGKKNSEKRLSEIWSHRKGHQTRHEVVDRLNLWDLTQPCLIADGQRSKSR